MAEHFESILHVLPYVMMQDEIKRAVAQAHFDAYATAIKNGKSPPQAMQMADAAAVAKRLALLKTDLPEQTES